VQSFFPLEILTEILKGGAVTEDAAAHVSKFGFGKIDNSQRWMVWCPKVYNEDVGDYVAIHLHKAKFVDAFSIDMPFGSPWQVSGVMLRAFADTGKPSASQFGTFLRSDASVI
jgi:hypothetical protein